ncbi:MAG: YceD family protein [Anaerolineae bacterium]
MLTINVGFLLSDGPGNHKNIDVNIHDAVRIADDLVAQSITGQLRLSRTKEGILVQSQLLVTVARECARCLEIFDHAIPVDVTELYASPHPIGETEFFVGQDAKLSLAPLIRAEVLIALSHREFCKDDCQGLCPICGINLNHEHCDCEQSAIDPRMAKLKELLDSDLS